jgi:hypothetical protein
MRICEGFHLKGREGDEEREMLSSWVREKREPKRPESSREQRLRVELILRPAVRGARLFLWEEAAEASVRGPGGFCRKAQERREFFERGIRSWERSKALKGEAHERWELKEASQAYGG